MDEYISFHYDPADKVHSGAKKLAEHLFIPMGKVNEEYSTYEQHFHPLST